MKNNKIYSIKILIGLILLIGCCSSFLLRGYKDNQSDYINNSKDKIDYVPDEVTAKKVAEAIWLPIYGKNIFKYRPFVATLKGDSCWIVQGTLESSLGGVPYIELRKDNCQVILVTHGK